MNVCYKQIVNQVYILIDIKICVNIPYDIYIKNNKFEYNQEILQMK